MERRGGSVVGTEEHRDVDPEEGIDAHSGVTGAQRAGYPYRRDGIAPPRQDLGDQHRISAVPEGDHIEAGLSQLTGRGARQTPPAGAVEDLNHHPGSIEQGGIGRGGAVGAEQRPRRSDDAEERQSA